MELAAKIKFWFDEGSFIMFVFIKNKHIEMTKPEIDGLSNW